MSNLYLEKIAEIMEKEASKAKARSKRQLMNQERKQHGSAIKENEARDFASSYADEYPTHSYADAPQFSSPTHGHEMANSMAEAQPTKKYGPLRSRWNALAPATQKKLKIGGAIGGALALGGAGYAAMNHEKAASVALLINEGFSVDEAVALIGE